VQECVPLLELAKRRQLIGEQVHKDLKDELETLSKMLSGLIKGVDNCVK